MVYPTRSLRPASTYRVIAPRPPQTLTPLPGHGTASILSPSIPGYRTIAPRPPETRHGAQGLLQTSVAVPVVPMTASVSSQLTTASSQPCLPRRRRRDPRSQLSAANHKQPCTNQSGRAADLPLSAANSPPLPPYFGNILPHVQLRSSILIC